MLPYRLKQLRKESGETQQQTAAACGMARVTYARYEAGIHAADPEYLKKLAKHFNVSVDYLLGVSNQRTQQVAPPPKMTKDEFAVLYDSLSQEKKNALLEFLREMTKE